MAVPMVRALAVLRHATGNEQFQKGRQQLATHLYKFYKKIVKPLEDKMVDAALTQVMKIFEEHVLENDKVKTIVQRVQQLMQDANRRIQKTLTKKMKSGSQKVAVEAFGKMATKAKGMFRLSNMVPMLLKPLKDYVLMSVLESITKFFYTLWDALLNWAGRAPIFFLKQIRDGICRDPAPI